MPVPAALLQALVDPAVVDVPARTVLAIDGAGPPGGEPFARALAALYGVTYALKFARKKAARGELKIGPLEGRWAADVPAGHTGRPPPEAWRWRLRLGVPDDVVDAEIDAVVLAVTSKRGGKLEGSTEAGSVWIERVPARRAGVVLHVGPYADEPRSFVKLDAALAAAGLTGEPHHLELYLSDPRRTAPARRRTVLVREVATAARSRSSS
jgi:hypothetical protein